ncbi:MAG: phytanoyl-CoA dioxygenase family protein [Pseudomonadota bacterium]
MTDIKTAYQRDGYVVVRGLIPEATLESVAGELATAFHARAQALGLDVAATTDHAGFSRLLTAVFDADQRSYMATAKMTQALASMHSLASGPEVVGVVRDLGLTIPVVSTKPVIHYMADALKITGGYHKTAPHQDWRSVQGSLDGLTIWAPLFDVGPRDYPLEIVPGSHLKGLLPAVEDRPNWRVDDSLWSDADFQPLSLARGDAVFFSGFTVHRTGVQGGECVRTAFSFRFNNLLEPTYVERNFPDPYLYRPDWTLLREGFPSRAELARVFPAAAPQDASTAS